MLATFFLLLALVFAVLYTAAVPSHPRFNFLGASIAFWILSVLTGGTILHL